MKPLFLNIPTRKSDISISHQESILLLGSCFTENIGEKLIQAKFNCSTNPFGIIYNPISIANSLNRILQKQLYSESELSEHLGKYFSSDHHGSFSSFNQQQCLDKINNELTCAHQHLLETKTIVITFGTAWVYDLVESHKIVANCHKLPTKKFNKRLLTIDEILQVWIPIVEQFKNTCPTARRVNFIFTVSPVRHINDGLHENNISKSVLHLAIHELTKQYANCHYFGAYEMVIDELRDYRFYKEDMIHPTPQAVDYVWEKFSETYFTDETKTLNLKIEKLKNAVNHKPFNFDSASHQQFIADQLNLMDELVKNHSFLNFEKEKREIQRLQ